MKLKNKKSLLYIVLVLVVFLVLGTIAYFTFTDTLENIFLSGTYKTKTTEVFTSPTNWTPGDETPKTITTKNEGTIPVRVRVKLDESWTSKNGDEISNDICERYNSNNYCLEYYQAAVINLDNENDWLKKGDYYYYLHELAPGESTTSLLESVTFNPKVEASVTCTFENGANTCESTGDGYDGATYQLDITIETVQANKYESVWENVPIMYDYVGDNPCTFNGELVPGAEYVNGQYTCRYRQDYNGNNGWLNTLDDGWGVKLTDFDSTDSVITTLCSSINNKPIISMKNMFSNSKATSIDLNSFDTTNVKSMKNMFRKSQATSLDLSSFNTSNVTDMGSMFLGNQATTLDVSNFDTSKVTDMKYMFRLSQATTINVSSFNTSKVSSMSGMFWGSQATSLNLSNFDTTNVTDMGSMFSETQATTIDVSSFDTTNVTDMGSMFSNSEVLTLNLQNFNTNKVTTMYSMFSNTKVTFLNLSNFDTTNVTDMGSMFSNSEVLTLNLQNFNTSKVNNMSFMFSDSKITTLNVSSFDTSKVITMYSMFYNTKLNEIDLSSFDMSSVIHSEIMFWQTLATTGYGRTQADCDRLNASSGKPAGLTFVVKS